jgi:hypothetical protein
MSRVEPVHRNEEKRESQPRQQKTSNVGHTPSKAEGDEHTVDEALRNQEKTRK